MPTTTAEAIRDRRLDVVEAIVPNQLGGDKFRRYRNEGDGDFEAWCETNPPAAWRRFQIRDTGDDDPPEVTNLDVELRSTTYEVRVAYQQTSRAGRDAALDRDDVLEGDYVQIRAAIGETGRGNFAAPYPDACVDGLAISMERVNGTAVDFMVMRLTMSFYRAMS